MGARKSEERKEMRAVFDATARQKVPSPNMIQTIINRLFRRANPPDLYTKHNTKNNPENKNSTDLKDAFLRRINFNWTFAKLIKPYCQRTYNQNFADF